LRVETLETREVHLRELDRRDLARLDEGRERRDVREREVFEVRRPRESRRRGRIGQRDGLGLEARRPDLHARQEWREDERRRDRVVERGLPRVLVPVELLADALAHHLELRIREVEPDDAPRRAHLLDREPRRRRLLLRRARRLLGRGRRLLKEYG